MPDPTVVAKSNPSAETRHSAVVCAACGCACDDIELILNGKKLVEAVNACSIGLPWFEEGCRTVETRAFTAEIDGEPATYEVAISRSAELLRQSRSPVILGLTHTTMETVQAAVALADFVGASIDVGPSSYSQAAIHAFQRLGKVMSTLGEVKNRADVVVFWGADPVSTHPRHFERYSVNSTGRFRPGGRSDRTVFAVTDRETTTARVADHVVKVPADRQIQTIWTMRAMLAGRPLRGDGAGSSSESEQENLTLLVDRLKRAEFGAVFYDSRYGELPHGLAIIEALTALVRDFNKDARCVLLPLGSAGNRSGGESVLSWQTGFPLGVDLGAGHPESIPGVTSAGDRLRRREADLVVIVADPISESLGAKAIQHLQSIPRIVVAPPTVRFDFVPTVRLTPANPFLTSRGTMVRCDGVALPLRGPVPAEGPSDRECLLAILSAVQASD